MPASPPAERLQKVLSQLGLASRREAEGWIRAGRLTVNGQPAVLGMRVQPSDQLRLDGRLIRQRLSKPARESTGVYLCHRSPGEPLLPARRAETATENTSLAERLPRSAGRRFVSVSPMPLLDGGLELLCADGAAATRLQRAVHGLESEFSLRLRGELSDEQRQAIGEGRLDDGSTLSILSLEASGGESSNRWYTLVARGASGNQIRQLLERQAVTVVRMLRVRLGSVGLPRTLMRSHWRELTSEELSALLGSPGSDR